MQSGTGTRRPEPGSPGGRQDRHRDQRSRRGVVGLVRGLHPAAGDRGDVRPRRRRRPARGLAAVLLRCRLPGRDVDRDHGQVMDGMDVEEFAEPVYVDGDAPDSGHEPYVPPATTSNPPPQPTRKPTTVGHDQDPEAEADRDPDADAHADAHADAGPDAAPDRRRAADPGPDEPVPPPRPDGDGAAARDAVAGATHCGDRGDARSTSRVSPDAGRRGRAARSARRSAGRWATTPDSTRGGRRCAPCSCWPRSPCRSGSSPRRRASTSPAMPPTPAATPTCAGRTPRRRTSPAGFAEGNWPFTDDEQVRARYAPAWMTPLPAYVAFVSQRVTALISGRPTSTPAHCCRSVTWPRIRRAARGPHLHRWSTRSCSPASGCSRPAC